jgi:hypothetical protein
VGVRLGKELVNSARNLRTNFTEAERYLWRYLRGNQLEGSKFRRQQPIGPSPLAVARATARAGLTLSHRGRGNKTKIFDNTFWNINRRRV